MIFKIIILLISLLAVISASSSEKNNSIDKDILENDINENKNPSKRGAYYHGHGLYPEAYSSSSYYGYQIPNIGGQILNKPLLSSRPVAFSAPAGFGASIHYANSPAIFSNSIQKHPAPVYFGVSAHPPPVHFGVPAQHAHTPVNYGVPANPAPVHFGVSPYPTPVHLGVPAHPEPVHFGISAHPTPVQFGIPAHPAPVHFGAPAQPAAAIAPLAPLTQYAIRPGSAVVQSYNVNYPQLQYHHKHYPTYPFAGLPAPAAIAPAAPVIPANNLHYHPTFAASPAHVGFSFPPVASLPPPPPVAQFAPQHFFVNRPPGIGIQFAAAPLPTSVVPQRPTFVTFGSPSPTLSTFPSVIPVASGSAIAPGHIPAATPITPTIPTTLATPWRPILINNSPTTTATPQPVGSSGNRPPISLLPPYGIAEKPNEDFSHYYNTQNTQELTEQNYYAAEQANKGYNY